MLATGNAHKLGEFRSILAPHEVQAMPAGIELPPEGIESFEANAIGKACGLAEALTARTQPTDEASAVPSIVIADDSGLEVQGLGWEPGVISARYAGEDADDRDNYELLLRRLDGAPPESRRARFVCVLAAVVPAALLVPGSGTPGTPYPAAPAREPLVYAVRGEWWGIITRQPHGDGGFGYDPVFLPDGSDLTVAQLPQSVKDQASHRALAGRALLERFEKEGVRGVGQPVS